MLKELSISSVNGDSLSLSIPGSNNGYRVEKIEGLDPVSTSISSTALAQIPGEIYQASREEKRNIIIKIRLSKAYGITTIDFRRTRLYSLFAGKRPIHLQFDTDRYGMVEIYGYVETIDAPTFIDKPYFEVSLVCFEPFFKGVDIVELNFNSTDGAQQINYEGTVATGFELIAATSGRTMQTASIAVQDVLLLAAYQLNLTSISIAGNTTDLYVNTKVREKEVASVLRSTGVKTSVLAMLSVSGEGWPVLQPGTNYVTVGATTASTPLATCQLKFNPLYKGI